MPEIKHHFRAGRMNKDLDERLVPNGEYRDAQNIEIITSEGSDIGSIQNSLGNTLINGKKLNVGTNTVSNWSADFISELTNAKCIGHVVDNENNKIYWMIAATGVSCIAEYDDVTKEVLPVIVDKLSIINFSADYPITGVNVIEGLLAWTDNQTDPKKINIEKFKSGSIDFDTQTTYNGTVMNSTQRSAASSFKNENITTIKLGPRNAPTLVLSSSKRTGSGTSSSSNNVIVSYNFSSTTTADVINVGEEFNIEFSPTPNFLKEDVITLTTVQENSDNTSSTYELTIKIIELLNEANSVRAVLLTKPSDLPNGALIFSCLLEEGKALFDKKLIRFAYRWKYNDGEYSTLSPFSDVAFLPGKFSYKSDDGYNNGMLNTVRSIVISGFTKPFDVEKVEVLLKESNSNLIYLTHTINDSSTSYTVESETLGLVIPSNQLLRPWDNVPLKAKAQETIGNRLVYGNYTQGYDIEDHNLPDISVTSKTTQRILSENPIGVGIKSLKSERTYQVGVVYSDYFQRETPVFSSKKSSIIINKVQADSTNSLSARIDSIPPDWATHYKYFVKETSNEYYNLALDRFYIAKDDSVWLSFPSSERNKISEERYITLKKKHDSDDFVKESAKYRILDIQNEAPRSLTVDLNLRSSYRAYTYANGSNVPAVNSSYFKFRGPTDVENPEFARSFNSMGYVTITTYLNGTEIGTTDKYKIESGGINGETDGSGVTTVYEVNLEDGFESKESSILSSTNLGNDVYFKVNIFQETSTYKSEFSGRFFVKVNRDTILDDNVINAFSLNKVKYSVKEKKSISLDSTNDSTESNGNNSSISWTDSKADTNDFLDLRILDNEHPKLDNKTFSFVLSGVDTGENTIDHYLNDDINSFLSKIKQAGTLIQFSNTGGYSGSIYKVTSTEVVASYRSDTTSKKRKISGKRRRYNINFESLKDGGGYEDNFLVSGSLDTSIITEIAIVKREIDFENDNLTSENPAIFETEPVTSIDLDLFYEVSNPLFILKPGMKIQNTEQTTKHVITGINNSVDTTTGIKSTIISWSGTINSTINAGYTYRIWSSDELYYQDVSTTGTNSTTSITLSNSNKIHGFNNSIDWFNCFSFGNGVESNRIQDDFNAIYIDKGPVVSSTIDTRYKSDHKKSGLIFSGIINSISGVNDLNQFIQAEAITKELNPEYGSIQRLIARDTDLVTFCEDKVVRILANKDALYNADGNPQLTASNNVLGQTIPYLGEYGCSKFPEAICSYGYRMYFLDRARSCVLRLSRDGITNISEKGMGDWFNDNIPLSNSFLGTFDENKKCYNITLNNYTISFDERVDGWTSFRSFIPEFGTSLNGLYYTFNQGLLYSHNNVVRNNFYGTGYQSSVNVLINEVPSSIKQFKTLNYEGSASRAYTYNTDYSSSTNTTGWYANSLKTEKQTGSVKEFVNKEGLWSNFISGDTTSIDNLDAKEFSVQGVGSFASIAGATARTQVNITKTLTATGANISGKVTISDPVKFVQNINSTVSNTSVFTITPLTGYSLTHTNFSGTGCTFTQSGNNVSCSLVSSDVAVTSNIASTINVTHSGVITGTTYSIALTYETFEENTSTLSRVNTATYSNGVADVDSQLFTITFTPDSNFEFNTAPTASVVYSNGGGGKNMYTITNDWDSTDKDGPVVFTVRYTFGSKNTTGDKIVFVAKAVKELEVVPISITGVDISKRNILATGETRSFKIYGTPGATFNVIKRIVERSKTVDATNYTLQGGDSSNIENNETDFIQYWHGTTHAWQSYSYVGQHYIPSSGVYDFDEVIPALTNSNEKLIYYRIDPGVKQWNESGVQVFNNNPLTLVKRSKYNGNGTVNYLFPGDNVVSYDSANSRPNFATTSTASSTSSSTGLKFTFATQQTVQLESPQPSGSWATEVTWEGMPAGRKFLVFNRGGTITDNGDNNYSATEIFIKELLLSNNVNGIMTRYFPGGNLLTHMVTPLAIPQVPSGTVVTFSMVNKDVFGHILLKQIPDVKVKLKLKKETPDSVFNFPPGGVETTVTARYNHNPVVLVTTVDGAVAGSTITLDSKAGIIAGQIVTGIGISGGNLLTYTNLLYVRSVSPGGSSDKEITLSTTSGGNVVNVNLDDGTELTFRTATTDLVVDNLAGGSVRVGDLVTGTGIPANLKVTNGAAAIGTVVSSTTSFVVDALHLIPDNTEIKFRTTSSTYDVVSSYAEHEPVSASKKYLTKITSLIPSVDLTSDSDSFILSEVKEISSSDFKYEKATAVYTGSSLLSGTSLSFIASNSSTGKVKGAISSASTLIVDEEVGDVAIGDVITGTGISGSPVTVTAVDSSSTTQKTLTLSSAQSLTDNVVLTFTYSISTEIPDAVYVGSSIDYNLYNASTGVTTAYTNTVSNIDANRTTITLGTAVTSASAIPTDTVLLFNKTTPIDWDFDIKNANGSLSSLTAAGNTYTLTSDIEVSKYGISDVTLELDLDKLLGYKLEGTATVFAPSFSKKAIKTVASGDVNEVVLLSGHNRIITGDSSIQTYRGTGYIIAELIGNVLNEGGNTTQGGENQIVINASGFGPGQDSPDITSFEIFSLRTTSPDYTDTWTTLSNGKYQGLSASKLGFGWSANIAANVSVSDTLKITFTVTKSGSFA